MSINDLSLIGRVIYVAVLCAVTYFGVANSLIHVVNSFRFYLPFSRKLEGQGVMEDVFRKKFATSRCVGSVFMFLLTLAMAVWLTLRTRPIGYYAAGASLLFGVILYSKTLRYELWNVQHYAKQYKDYMDKDKFAVFLQKEYGVPLSKLSDDAFVLGYKRKK